jgi:hypothetical protein
MEVTDITGWVYLVAVVALAIYLARLMKILTGIVVSLQEVRNILVRRARSEADADR